MLLAVHVTPKASRSEITGWALDAEGKRVLKVRIAAPPEDGKANSELLRFLARQWNVPKSALELVSGEASRHKRLKINDENLAKRLFA